MNCPENRPTDAVLVLEGGSMRGLFTCGILDVFLEEGIRFDATVAVSAGAAFGCNLKSRQIGRALRYNTTYCRDRRYCSLHSLFTTGDLYGADFCYRALPDELDPFDYETYRNDPMDFFCVCTDTLTAEPVYRKVNTLNSEEFLYLRASASLPVVSRPVEVEGQLLLDGGISDSIPLNFARSLGHRKCVLILTREESYRKKAAKGRALLSLLLRKTPKIYDAILSRHERYNEALAEIEKLEKQGEIFVFRPPRPIGTRTVEKSAKRLRAAWQLGYDTAKEQLGDLREYLKG